MTICRCISRGASNYSPPPGGDQFPDQRAGTPRGIQREALRQPGGLTTPSYGQPLAVVYGNRGPEPYPQLHPPPTRCRCPTGVQRPGRQRTARKLWRCTAILPAQVLRAVAERRPSG